MKSISIRVLASDPGYDHVDFGEKYGPTFRIPSSGMNRHVDHGDCSCWACIYIIVLSDRDPSTFCRAHHSACGKKNGVCGSGDPKG